MKFFKGSATKTTIIIISVALLMIAAVGTTLAIIIDKSAPITNTFTPGSVSCSVIETFNQGGITKSDVKIANSGDTAAFIRCAIVINWKNENDDVYGEVPLEGTHYQISYNDTDWFLADDGFWYFPHSVDPTQTTDVLINSCSVIGAAPAEGYTLSVDILASAVQASPASAVSEAFGISCVDGTLVKNGGQ